MAEKIATREAYGNALVEFANDYDFVVLDADLAAATKTGVFKKKHPERFFNCGIAEGNMMCVAAGIAATGKNVFASSFAMFAAGRAFEQIRNAIGYPHLNVKIAATHAGISVGEDGATHQCLEDVALMRTIPGMTVLCPADHYEMMAATKAAVELEGPVYVRLGRLAIDSFNEIKKFASDMLTTTMDEIYRDMGLGDRKNALLSHIKTMKSAVESNDKVLIKHFAKLWNVKENKPTVLKELEYLDEYIKNKTK